MAVSQGDLKRVGLEFTAKGAVDFKKSISGVSSSLKEARAELKLAKSTYDENTTSTQKLADRQKYLSEVTDTYKDKVRILQEQLDELQQQEDVSAGAIDKQKTKLEEAQAQANKYSKELEDVNRQLQNHAGTLKDAGDKLTDISDKSGKVGSALTKGITAPVAGIAAASMAAFTDVDSGMDTIVTKTGATGDALEEMQNIAKDIATTIPTSFEDAGTAVGEVNTRFEATGEELQSLSEQFIEFAEINGTDVSGSIDSVQKAMAAFGLSTDDASGFLGALTAAGQASGVSVDTLTTDLVANSTAFGEMGMSASDAISFLADMEKSGINTSDVLRGLKKVQTEAAESGVSFSDALQSAFSSSGNAIDVFGSKIGVQLYDSMQNGLISIDDFASGGAEDLSGFETTVSDTFNATLDPVDKFQVALNDLKLVGSEIIEAAAPIITSVADTLIPILEKINTWWTGLSPQMQDFIIKAALVAGAMGPLISGFSKITGGIGSMLTNMAGAAGGVGKLGGVLSMLGGPVGIAIAAITALIPVLISLYNNNETFRNAVNTAWEAIKTVISTVVDAIKVIWETVLQPVFAAIGDFVQNILWPIIQIVFMMIGEVIRVQFELIKGFWENILQPAFQAIGDFVQNVLWPVIQTIFQAIGDFIGTVFSGIQSFWENILRPVFQAIGDFLTGTLGPIFQTIFDGISTVVSTVFDGIRSFWDNILHPVFEAIGSALDVLWSAFDTVFSPMYDLVSDVFTRIQDFLSPVIDWLKGIFDFSWDLPHISLPHFSVSGQFSLNPPSIPHFSVEWYAKAMDTAFVLTNPSIFGASGGSLLGGGEAGREVVAGEDHLVELFHDSVASASMDPASLQKVITAAVLSALKASGFSVNLDGEKVGDFISDYLRREVLA